MNIVLDIIILAVLLVPLVIGLFKGFVHTVLHLGKTLIAFLVSCAFVKPLAVWVKTKWIYNVTRENMTELFMGGEHSTEEQLIEAVPEGIRNTLSTVGMDVNSMANEAVQAGEAMKESFIESLSQSVSGVISFAIAFAVLFLGTILLIFVLRPLINWLATHLPVVKTCNTLLGGVFGLLLGLIFAWVAAQLLVSIGGLFLHYDWTETYLLSFFYRVTPLKWLLQIAIQSIATISAL